MPKKKAANTGIGGKAASKAAKRAKAAAKEEKKETKKAKLATSNSGMRKGKSAAKEEDDQDLEGILEKVRAKMLAGRCKLLTYRCRSLWLFHSTRCDTTGNWPILSQKNSLMARRVDVQMRR
jgi:hypothetical protein